MAQKAHIRLLYMAIEKVKKERVYGGAPADSEIITIFIQNAQLCMQLGFLSIKFLNRFSEFVMIHIRIYEK